MPISHIKANRRDLMLGVAAVALATSAPRAQAADTKIKKWRHYADCRFGQIHFMSAEPADGAGKQKTPLVCLHQSPASGDAYREFLHVMAQDRLVMCPDAPGFGGSDKPSALPTMADYGAAMAEALTNMGYGTNAKGTKSLGPVDWLGFHTGNFIICEISAQRPDLARRLVMPAIPYFPPAEREDKRKQFAVPRPYFTDPDFVGKSFQDTVINAKSPLPKERLLELFTERLRAGPESWWGFDAVFRYDAEAALAKIRHDVLLPIMQAETLAEPTRQAAKFLTSAKSVTMLELPGLSGVAWQTTPEKIADAIRPFLDKA